jgi:hypothetical protein
MTENKTRATGASVEAFLAAVEHPVRRAEGFHLAELMSGITGQQAEMWGPSIVGFGRYHYKYATGREGDAPAVGFSPRKSSLSLYGLTHGLTDAPAGGPAGGSSDGPSDGPGSAELLGRLGRHKLGAGCLYVNKLEDIDESVLTELIRRGYRHATTELHHG